MNLNTKEFSDGYTYYRNSKIVIEILLLSVVVFIFSKYFDKYLLHALIIYFGITIKYDNYFYIYLVRLQQHLIMDNISESAEKSESSINRLAEIMRE